MRKREKMTELKLNLSIRTFVKSLDLRVLEKKTDHLLKHGFEILQLEVYFLTGFRKCIIDNFN